MPVKSVLASKFHRLTDIYHKLEKQNEVIYEREQQLGSLEKELANTKGVFKGKQRKELQEQISMVKEFMQLQYDCGNLAGYLSFKEFYDYMKKE